MSPSGVSWISVFPFQTCRSLDELWIFWVGQATCKYQTGRKIWNPRTPSTMQACSFFLNPFSEFCLLTPAFFFSPSWHIVAQVRASIWHFQSVALEPEILWKGNLPDPVVHTFLLLCHFIQIWTYKTHDLTDHQLIIRSFPPAITFMWSDRQIPGRHQFSQQQVFPSLPSLVDFKCAIIVRSFHLDFLCAN